MSLQHWLLCFGALSSVLRLTVAYFTEWLGKGPPPWATYRALISGRLITLDKNPGIRLVRVGETWWRLMAKCVVRVMGQEAKAVCKREQLDGGVEAGIEDGIHDMRLLWAQYIPGGGLGVPPH